MAVMRLNRHSGSHSCCSVAKSSPTLSPPGSSVHVISQARILQWLPFPFPGDLPDPVIEPLCQTLAGSIFFTAEPPGNSEVIQWEMLKNERYHPLGHPGTPIPR